LIETVCAGDVDQAEAILRLRPKLVNWEAPASHGHMALHYAVLQRMPEMVRVLMRFGSDPPVTESMRCGTLRRWMCSRSSDADAIGSIRRDCLDQC
jgi:hypothetical protein